LDARGNYQGIRGLRERSLAGAGGARPWRLRRTRRVTRAISSTIFTWMRGQVSMSALTQNKGLFPPISRALFIASPVAAFLNWRACSAAWWISIRPSQHLSSDSTPPDILESRQRHREATAALSVLAPLERTVLEEHLAGEGLSERALAERHKLSRYGHTRIAGRCVGQGRGRVRAHSGGFQDPGERRGTFVEVRSIAARRGGTIGYVGG